jgi:hypothetical protein
MHRLTEFVFRIFGKSRERSAGATLSISKDVIASAHTDGVVFLHTGAGVVFNSNQVGARIWRGLAGHEPLAAITAAIARQYGVEAERVERDATEFLTELEARGLLTRAAR